jgi:hypothetical protein
MPRCLATIAKRSMRVDSGARTGIEVAFPEDPDPNMSEPQAFSDDGSRNHDADAESTADSFFSHVTQRAAAQDATSVFEGGIDDEDISISNRMASQSNDVSDSFMQCGGINMIPYDEELENLIGQLRSSWNRIGEAQYDAVERGEDFDRCRESLQQTRAELGQSHGDLFLQDLALEIAEGKVLGQLIETGSDLEQLLRERQELDRKRQRFRLQQEENERIIRGQMRCFAEDDKLRAKEKARLQGLKDNLMSEVESLVRWTDKTLIDLQEEMAEKREKLCDSTGF